MGIFGSSASIHPAVEGVLACPPEHDQNAKFARKVIARESSAIVANTDNETLFLVSQGQSGMSQAVVCQRILKIDPFRDRES